MHEVVKEGNETENKTVYKSLQTYDDTNDNNEGKKDFRWQSWPNNNFMYWDVYSSRLSFMIIL